LFALDIIGGLFSLGKKQTKTALKAVSAVVQQETRLIRFVRISSVFAGAAQATTVISFHAALHGYNPRILGTPACNSLAAV